jgi:hypothetical protein
MSSEEDVLSALKALADADREKEAPPEVEERLRSTFRKRRSKPVWQWAIAAAVLIALVAAAVHNWPKRAEVASVVPPVVKQATDIPDGRSLTVAVPQRVQAASKAPRRRQQREVVTEFFPLMEVPPPLDRGELVRVSLPASAMRTVGLPVRDDRLSERVQADVLVSEEGLATAIRFVKFQ